MKRGATMPCPGTARLSPSLLATGGYTDVSTCAAAKLRSQSDRVSTGRGDDSGLHSGLELALLAPCPGPPAACHGVLLGLMSVTTMSGIGLFSPIHITGLLTVAQIHQPAHLDRSCRRCSTTDMLLLMLACTTDPPAASSISPATGPVGTAEEQRNTPALESCFSSAPPPLSGVRRDW